ncbi:toprim domain-containing protein [Parachlamydia acanthamoebae]|uniref:toprim domain-containing protein n=1 Tax=Parachlamydia acanthamoebae TaxID=83552 RepID=UPI0007510AAE|nr:toprim domain-containing protein [Parachlamydia acanthamoebae]
MNKPRKNKKNDASHLLNNSLAFEGFMELPAGIVIPYHSIAQGMLKVKIRRVNWHADDELPKYVEVSGSSKQLSCFGSIQESIATILVESEFDAILLHQEAYDFCASLALGGVSKKPDLETHLHLLKSSLILFALDFDESGKNAFSYWRSTYANLRAWPAPLVKSPGDAYLKGVDLRRWVLEGLEFYKK